MYKEIIEKNWKSGNEVIMSKSVDMVSDLLKNIKNEHPEMYWLFILDILPRLKTCGFYGT